MTSLLLQDELGVIDSLMSEADSLNRSHQMMDEMATMSRSILSSLSDQRSRFKGAHRKLLDVANTLGLSNFIIRAIERRESVDKLIVYGGMLFVLGFIWLLWSYFS